MAQQTTKIIERVSTDHDALRVLAILAAVLAVAAVLTVVFGVDVSAPAYELVPDPAGALPF
jgi:fructose-specific phosphotransferase system IIC component